LTARLAGRTVEVCGEPLPLLRQLSQADPEVEDVLMFGDRLHLRVGAGRARRVMARLKSKAPAQGGRIAQIRPVPPQLEDVFIALLEEKP
jgi:hypothetical protein